VSITWRWLRRADATAGDDVLRAAFAGPDIERALRPAIDVEQFGASPHYRWRLRIHGHPRAR